MDALETSLCQGIFLDLGHYSIMAHWCQVLFLYSTKYFLRICVVLQQSIPAGYFPGFDKSHPLIEPHSPQIIADDFQSNGV